VTAEQIAAIVAATTAAQGLSLKVSDQGVLRGVVALLGGPVAAGRARARSASTGRRAGRPASGGSVQPHGPDPGRVDAASTVDAGEDLHVGEDRLDDRGLPVEVQRRPRRSKRSTVADEVGEG